MIVFVLSFLDDGGRYFWRAFAAVPVVLGIGFGSLELILNKRVDSINYLVREKGFKETLARAEKVYDPITAKIMTKDFYVTSGIKENDSQEGN